jgi:addiction module RelE/StbE family toxin
MAKIVWSLTARRRLREIHEYISADSPEAADTFISEMDSAVGRLAQFPESGRLVPEAEGHGVREVIFRDYRVAYRTSGKDVVIITIWHGAMNVRGRFRP